MAQPYVGEIRMFGGNFAPAGWEFCEGQLMPISENETLFQLIGTAYGGDGENTFALPDLRGRIPVHQGGGLPYAVPGGVEYVALTFQQMPVHSHAFLAANVDGTFTPAQNNLPARSQNITPYINLGADTNMAATAVGPAGGSQPHTNFQPYLCVDFIISLFGIYPSPT